MDKEMAHPPGMEFHGKGWRVTKRVPKELRHLYGKDFIKYQTGEPDRRLADSLVWVWLGELEREFQRHREIAARDPSVISEDDARYLARLMVRSSLQADEEMRDDGMYADEGDFERHTAALDERERDARAGLGRGLLTPALCTIVDDWLWAHGYDIPRESDRYHAVCRVFAQERVEVIKAQKARLSGEVIETPALPTPPSQESEVPALKLSQVIDHFLGTRKKGTAMFKKFSTAMKLLLEVWGDRPVASLKQQEVDDFFALLCRLPPRWSDKKRQLGKTVQELASMDWDECINEKTFDDTYMAASRPFFVYACRVFGDQGFPRHFSVKGITYTGSRPRGENKQRAFRLDELKRLFEGTEYASFASDPAQEHYYWLPLLGLFTGARVNELCQLNPQCDIREEHGVWVLDITDESETDERVEKSVKNDPSRRKVPVHSTLISLGFLAYAKRIKDQGTALLFPQWPPVKRRASGKAEKWFRELLTSLGLRDETPKKRLVGFHAMRSTFLTRADHLDIPKPGTLTGHAQPFTNTEEELYKDATELAKNRSKMELLHYEVSFQPLVR